MDILELERIAAMPSPQEARQELERIKAEQATQAAINRAKEATETYSARFETSLTEVQAMRIELDNELKRIKELLTAYIQKRRSAIALADKTTQLAKWLAGARVRSQHPDGSQDWQITGAAEQLVMDLNGGKKYPMFLTQSPDDALFNNLVATIANETGELIVKPTKPVPMIQPESYQPGRTW